MSERGCTDLCEVCSAAATHQPCHQCGADLCAQHEPEPGLACTRCIRRRRFAIIAIGGLTGLLLIVALAAVRLSSGLLALFGCAWIAFLVGGGLWATIGVRYAVPELQLDPEPSEPTLPTARLVTKR